MAHIQMFKKVDLKGVVEEAERLARCYKNYVDPLRTHLNYNIGLECGLGSDIFLMKVNARVREIMQGRKIQVQTNLIGSIAMTYPADLCVTEYVRDKDGNIIYKEYPVIGSDGNPMCDEAEGIISEKEPLTYNKPIDPDHCKRFMQASFNYICLRYGKENVMAGFVHMDETTPHITVLVVPEAVSRKTGKKTVSSASLFTRQELLAFHPAYQRYLDEHMPEGSQRCCVMNGRTKGNYSLEELKYRTADIAAMGNLGDASAKLESIQNDIRNSQILRKQLRQKYDHNKSVIKTQEESISELTMKTKQHRKKFDSMKRETDEMKRIHEELCEDLSAVYYQIQKSLGELDETEDLRRQFTSLSEYVRKIKFKDGMSVFERWKLSSQKEMTENTHRWMSDKLDMLRSKHPKWFTGEDFLTEKFPDREPNLY